LLVGGVGVSWALLRRIAGVPLRRSVVEGAFAAYLVAVAYVVFSIGRLGRTESAYSWQQVNLVPLRTILEFARSEDVTHAVRQLAGNVVLFVPFGLLLPVMTARFRTVAPILLAAATASASIEILQLMLGLLGLASRSIDIDDVLLNTVGGLVGWAVWRAGYAVWRALSPGRLKGAAGEESVREPA
jgi:glycopeptide antibiotics resistance protein